MNGVNSAAPNGNGGQIIAGVYNATPPVLADGQSCAVQLDINGQVKTTGGGGGGGGNVNLTGINGVAPGLGHPLPVQLSDGAQAFGTLTNPLTVNIGAALPAGANVIGHVITDTGSVTAATLSAETTKVIGTVRILGNAGAIFDAATAATVPANAILQGLRAATAYPTAVTDGQLVAPMADKAGRHAVVINAPRDLIGTASVNASAASATSLIAAAGANIFTDIASLVITNETSTATIVSVTDGTTTYKFALAANGGIVLNFPTPLPAATANTAWTCGNSATVALDYVVVYVKNK